MQLLPNGISGHQAKVELTLSDVASLLTDIGTSLPARKRAIAEVAGMGGNTDVASAALERSERLPDDLNYSDGGDNT